MSSKWFWNHGRQHKPTESDQRFALKQYIYATGMMVAGILILVLGDGKGDSIFGFIYMLFSFFLMWISGRHEFGWTVHKFPGDKGPKGRNKHIDSSKQRVIKFKKGKRSN